MFTQYQNFNADAVITKISEATEKFLGLVPNETVRDSLLKLSATQVEYSRDMVKRGQEWQKTVAKAVESFDFNKLFKAV